MKNWKTTLTGAIIAAGYAALTYYQSGGLSVKDALIIAGFAALGVLSKDLNVTGK
jgi:hypothetical protein